MWRCDGDALEIVAKERVFAQEVEAIGIELIHGSPLGELQIAIAHLDDELGSDVLGDRVL
jgi:hypothetical protein